MTRLNQRTETPLALRVGHSSRDLVMATFGHVCVAIWNSKPSLALVEVQRAALMACALRYPQQALFMCIVSQGADPPDSDARAASVKMVREQDKKLIGCACVIESGGFRGAVTRSILTGMTLLAGTPIPIGFFGDVSGAVEWLQPRSSQPLIHLDEQLQTLRRLAS
jgi:hypothetical protein